MNQTLIKMAKKASQDPSLLASLINQYGENEGLHWDGIAQRLRIEPAQLAKLALCRRPRQTNFARDIAQIADYVGMQRPILKQFIQATEPAPSLASLSVSWSGFKRILDSFSGQRMWAMGVAALVLLVMGAVAFAQPKRSGANLVVAEGQATVFQAQIALLSSRQTEEIASAGDVISVNAGDVISVGEGSAAQIRLYDGSTVDLSENTTLEVSELIATDDTYRVDLKMLSGKTVNRVVRLLGVGDAFRVSTPSSTASVRGTVFTVEVISLDTTYVACDEGIVHVESGEQEAEVVAGTEVTAVLGEELEVEPQPAGPPEDKPADPPAGGGDPPGPPAEVPGNPPADPPGRGQPPAGGGDPPGPPAEVPGNPPEEVPVGQPEDVSDSSPEDTPVTAPEERPNGYPEEVPGHTPRKVPGNGHPPTGDGDPPGKSRSKRPVIGVPPGPPEEVPGNGLPGDKPDEPDDTDNAANGPPESVPGNTPADPPGEGQPPAAGGPPPGQDNNNSNDNNAGGNSDNNAGGNSSNNNSGGKKKG